MSLIINLIQLKGDLLHWQIDWEKAFENPYRAKGNKNAAQRKRVTEVIEVPLSFQEMRKRSRRSI